MATNDLLPDGDDFDPSDNIDRGAILDHTPLKFGKYKGKTAEYVADDDPDYLIWAYETVANFPVCSDALYRSIGGKKKRAKAKDEYGKQQEKKESFQHRPARSSLDDDEYDDDIPF